MKFIAVALICVLTGCKSNNETNAVSGLIGRQSNPTPPVVISMPTGAPVSAVVESPPVISIPVTGSPPVIEGMPLGTTLVGESYSFHPQASDADNDVLTFEIRNAPVWTQFDSTTGILSGRPGAEHVGTYNQIEIIVADATFSRALSAFSIEVVDSGERSVTLSWQSPRENEDGSPLFDLAGYLLSYGLEIGSETFVVNINNPGLSTYVIEGLVPGVYWFALSAYNGSGVESVLSNHVNLTLE